MGCRRLDLPVLGMFVRHASTGVRSLATGFGLLSEEAAAVPVPVLCHPSCRRATCSGF
jgi:hypothetical protein